MVDLREATRRPRVRGSRSRRRSRRRPPRGRRSPAGPRRPRRGSVGLADRRGRAARRSTAGASVFDGVAADELVDVERGGVRGVLRRRRRPQRPLQPCALAPPARPSARPENRSRNSWYASLALATAALPRSGWPSGRRRSVSVSTRLTKNDATDATVRRRRRLGDELLEARRGTPRSPRRGGRARRSA